MLGLQNHTYVTSAERHVARKSSTYENAPSSRAVVKKSNERASLSSPQAVHGGTVEGSPHLLVAKAPLARAVLQALTANAEACLMCASVTYDESRRRTGQSINASLREYTTTVLLDAPQICPKSANKGCDNSRRPRSQIKDEGRNENPYKAPIA